MLHIFLLRFPAPRCSEFKTTAPAQRPGSGFLPYLMKLRASGFSFHFRLFISPPPHTELFRSGFGAGSQHSQLLRIQNPRNYLNYNNIDKLTTAIVIYCSTFNWISVCKFTNHRLIFFFQRMSSGLYVIEQWQTLKLSFYFPLNYRFVISH